MRFFTSRAAGSGGKSVPEEGRGSNAACSMSKSRVGVPAACLAAAILTSCSIEMITPTVKPTVTPTPTVELPLASLLPTIAPVPSRTPTVTATSTPELLRPAEAGERYFHDSMDDPVSGWTLTNKESGSVAYSSGMLVFTVNGSYTPLVSELPREIPEDAYIEATVQTLLCGEGVDTFGIIFRNGREYSYRYAATCNGRLRFEAFKGSTMAGVSVWRDAPGWLQGAPASNRMGVLIRGRFFRFFVNGVEIFPGQDPMSYNGGVGLFAHTEKSKTLSVGFDDLTVYALKET
jgi:hypothetical protein